MMLGLALSPCNTALRVPGGGGASLLDRVLAYFAERRGVVWLPAPDTCFLSNTNLTPCTLGDPIGFMLDKSKGAGYADGQFTGLGEEKVTNGTFDTDSNWIISPEFPDSEVTISDGTLRVDSGSAYGEARSDALTGLVVGRNYLVSANVIAHVNNYFLMLSTSATNDTPGRVGLTDVDGTGLKTFTFVAPATTMYFYVATDRNVAAFVEVDNISVRELPGNHVIQNNVAQRFTFGAEWVGETELGEELVTNGDFSSGDTGWNVGNDWSTATGAAVFDGYGTTATASTTISQDVGFLPGQFVLLSFDVLGGTRFNDRCYVSIGDGAGPAGALRDLASLGVTGVGSYELVVEAGDVDSFLRFTAGTGAGSFSLDNISVRELPEAARVYYAENDGLDDLMEAPGVVAWGGGFYAAMAFNVLEEGGDTSSGDVFGRLNVGARESIGWRSSSAYQFGAEYRYDLGSLYNPRTAFGGVFGNRYVGDGWHDEDDLFVRVNTGASSSSITGVSDPETTPGTITLRADSKYRFYGGIWLDGMPPPQEGRDLMRDLLASKAKVSVA